MIALEFEILDVNNKIIQGLSCWSKVGPIQFLEKENCKKKTKNTVFCGKTRKIRCFSNYFKDSIAEQCHSHSMVPVGLGNISNI